MKISRIGLCLTVLILVAGCSHTPTFLTPILPTASETSADGITRAGLNEDAFWQGSPATIWSRLQQVPPSKLAATVESNSTRAAWIKLALISKRYGSNTEQLVQALTVWRAENPGHPANTLFSGNATLTNLAQGAPPKHIALLLPLQGPMGANGQAVRAGFLSAYYASLAKTHLQQTISFYDTSQASASALYQQAVSKGATMIVGPLTKNEVQALLNSGGLNVTTLALNYTDGGLPKNVYEFGLSPQDETQQVAGKVWQAGRSRALIIAPQSAWGQRMSKSFTERFQASGGRVIDAMYYSPQTDFNSAVPALLHVNVEAARHSTNNNKTQLEKLRRQDFDVIFLLAEPNTARKIVPLLRYYYADNIPIYATSTINSGVTNLKSGRDLNGVIFSDIPFALKTPGNPNRLNAVGRDAYVISRELPRLIQLNHFSLYGATGALTITAEQKIYHRLPMATMQ